MRRDRLKRQAVRRSKGGGGRKGESGGTSRGELGALAGAAVVVSVLGAERGAGVGEAARPSRRAAKPLCVNAAPWESRGRTLTTGLFFFQKKL